MNINLRNGPLNLPIPGSFAIDKGIGSRHKIGYGASDYTHVQDILFILSTFWTINWFIKLFPVHNKDFVRNNATFQRSDKVHYS